MLGFVFQLDLGSGVLMDYVKEFAQVLFSMPHADKDENSSVLSTEHACMCTIYLGKLYILIFGKNVWKLNSVPM